MPGGDTETRCGIYMPGGGVRDASWSLYGEKCTVNWCISRRRGLDMEQVCKYNMTVKLGHIKGG